MIREEFRLMLDEYGASGELYRGQILVKVARTWHIPRLTGQTFRTRQEARAWLDELWVQEYPQASCTPGTSALARPWSAVNKGGTGHHHAR